MYLLLSETLECVVLSSNLEVEINLSKIRNVTQNTKHIPRSEKERQEEKGKMCNQKEQEGDELKK